MTGNSKNIVKQMQKRPFICTSITSDNKRGFITTAKKAVMGGADLAELRIDFLKDPSPENIKQIISESPIPLIVTNRNKENRGTFKGSESLRISLLHSAIEAKPAFVDIELHAESSSRDEIIQSAHAKHVSVICSYHDFQKTPSAEEMIDTYKEICETGADLAKMVYTPHTEQDLIEIFKATQALQKEKTPYALFGMGEMGQITRLLCHVIGSCLTYCAVKPDPNNGLFQISLKETKSLFDTVSATKGWTSIRKEHKDLLALAIWELTSKESYPFTGKKIVH